MKTTKPEPPATVYEKMYENRTYENPQESAYYPLYLAAVKAIKACGGRHVLEVGCGSGELAEILIRQGFDYRGFDYAHMGIEKALRRCPTAKFAWGDANTDSPYAELYDTIVCCEVLEHIACDLEVIRRWRPGCNVVCSVPSFDYETHVRFFCTENDVRGRYGDLITIDKVCRLPKSQWSGLTWPEYFRRIRWAREGGWRNVLGMLGINRFDWSGGWFLFTGTRR